MGEKDNHCFRVLIDADACPVYRIAEWEAKERNIAVILFGDTNHVLTSDYSEIRVIGAGADAVDFALINQCKPGDIIITQDYGVAAMALGKDAHAIHQSGKWYTNENIDRMLMERHLAKKARMGKGKHHLKGPGKRTVGDDEIFAFWDADKHEDFAYSSNMQVKADTIIAALCSKVSEGTRNNNEKIVCARPEFLYEAILRRFEIQHEDIMGEL